MAEELFDDPAAPVKAARKAKRASKGPLALAPGVEVQAEFTGAGLVALHKPACGGKGYCLTHAPSGALILRTRLKTQAKSFQKELEACDWSDAESLRAAVVAKIGQADKNW
jgi:hypothetical protein